MKNNALAEAGCKPVSRRNNVFRSWILPFLICLLLSVAIWLTATNVTSASDDASEDNDTVTTVETI